MKQFFKNTLRICALLSTCLLVVSTSANVRIRSQSVDSARELVGWTDKINYIGDEWANYGVFAVTPEYTRSFKSKDIARCLFGDAIINDTKVNCGKKGASFKVSGSQVANRGSQDLLADYFGLPTDFESTVTVKPTIENFLVDFNFYLGHSSRVTGLWCRIHAPIVYTRWKLNFCETVDAAGVNDYAAGYFAPGAVARGDLLDNFGQYLSGQVPTLNGGVVFEKLQKQRIATANDDSNCLVGCANDCDNSLSATRLSDVQGVIGWNFYECEDYHLGVGLRFSAPTGTKIRNNFLFQPQIGNGHHWELGGMITSHYTFWRNCDDTKRWGFFFDANITHMFSANQCRTFDLCCRGDNSKYMLAEKMGLPIIDSLVGNTVSQSPAPGSGYTAPTSVFKNVFVPVANLTSAVVKVSVPVQADITALFNYTTCDLSWDVGYNFWSTSCERIRPCITNNQQIFTGNTQYALKGDAFVYGFAAEATNPSTIVNVPLSATETGTGCFSATSATIHTGTNFDGINSVATATRNPGIDNPQFAYAQGSSVPNLVNTTTALNSQTRTSIQPILLADTDVDYASARVKGMSHKFFTHVSYTWEEKCWKPYLGIGGKVEVATRNNDCADNSFSATTDCAANGCATSCRTCDECAVSEWGIWLKGGISFN